MATVKEEDRRIGFSCQSNNNVNVLLRKENSGKTTQLVVLLE